MTGNYGDLEPTMFALVTVGSDLAEVTDLRCVGRGQKCPSVDLKLRSSEFSFPIGFGGELHIGCHSERADSLDIANTANADHPGSTDIDPFRHAIERGRVREKFARSGFIAEASGKIDGSSDVVVPVEQQGHTTGHAGAQVDGEGLEAAGEFGHGGHDRTRFDADQEHAITEPFRHPGAPTSGDFLDRRSEHLKRPNGPSGTMAFGKSRETADVNEREGSLEFDRTAGGWQRFGSLGTQPGGRCRHRIGVIGATWIGGTVCVSH